MIIKKHKNKNNYLLTKHGHWVRDFTRAVFPQDINNLLDASEYQKIVENELRIASLNLPSIDLEHIQAPNVVIVSDGYKFQEKKHLLKKLPRNIIIIGTNRSLANWSIDLRMDYFVVNNPYKECMTYFPTISYFPKCIASCRTNPDFVRRYKSVRGLIYQYTPVQDKRYGGVRNAIYSIDDYRNPICAAISLAFRWGVRKLALFCCDDVFEGERPGAVKQANGLYLYPPQEVGHELIDASLYWIQHQEFKSVSVVNHSEGPNYENAPYIKEEDFEGFFV